MQASLTGTVAADNTIALPADCRQVQSLRINVGGVYQELHPLPPERLADTITSAYPVGYVTVGRVATLIGGNSTPDFALTYFQAVPALSDDAPINWLLQREPGLYLYATILEAAGWIRDGDIADVATRQYVSLMEGVTAEDVGARYGNAPAIGNPIRNAP
jgi:hypothetical protein